MYFLLEIFSLFSIIQFAAMYISKANKKRDHHQRNKSRGLDE